MSCQYYGYNGMYGTLIPTGGNQCGLITSSHAPCVMEVTGKPVDENACPLVEVKRLGVRLEPDFGPGPFHRNIISKASIPGRRAHVCYLECGHQVTTIGRVELADGMMFCRECQEAARRPRG